MFDVAPTSVADRPPVVPSGSAFDGCASFGACVEVGDRLVAAELDDQLRANELAMRRLVAERAVLVGAIERRGEFAAEHRSMAGYLRATTNCSDATAARDRRLARLVGEHPVVGEALRSGHIAVDHVVQISRLTVNPRLRPFVPHLMAVLVESAEHLSHRRFADQVTSLIARLDTDGAFADLVDDVEGRRATVVEVGGGLFVSAHGGDPVLAARVRAVFDAFVTAEFRRDVEARRAEHGDAAEQFPLARTHAQRTFDALVAIFAAAHGSPEGRSLPPTVVDVVVDARTLHETLTHAAITLPNGQVLDLDPAGAPTRSADLLADLVTELAADPTGFLDRRCETAAGSPVHPGVLLRALLTGHVRRVVVDSRKVVTDLGVRRRLFTGASREAALLLARHCVFPGCDMPAAWSQVDHNLEHHAGGRTDQDNSNAACGHHNRAKHRRRWRTARDDHGRTVTVRPDGSLVLPVGERPPDLTVDQHTRAARQRLLQLVGQVV